jgi:hypothetical protein
MNKNMDIKEFVSSLTEDEFGAVCAAVNWIGSDEFGSVNVRMDNLGIALHERAERDLDRSGVSINPDILPF